jgi:DNA-binding transcriptional LysR family regulator
MLVALAQQHPLAKKRKIAFSDLEKEKLFWFERRSNPGVYDYCKGKFDEMSFAPDTLPEPEDHHLLLGMIAQGRGVALVSQSLLRLQRKGVVFRPLKEDAGLRMGIALAYDSANPSPLLRRLVSLVS